LAQADGFRSSLGRGEDERLAQADGFPLFRDWEGPPVGWARLGF